MKSPVSLDFVILLALGFNFLSWIFLPSRLAVYFIIFFALMMVYLWYDWRLSQADEDAQQSLWRGKKMVMLITVGFIITSTLGIHIIQRQDMPETKVHDGAAQMEQAVVALLAGRSPYGEEFFRTNQTQYAVTDTIFLPAMPNPGIYHLVQLPWQLVASVPVYLVTQTLFGFYDQRLTYLLVFILTLPFLFRLAERQADKFLLTVLFTLNPLFLPYLAEGRNEAFVLGFVVLMLYLLKQGKFKWASLALGLAGASKHYALFLVPFYLVYLYRTLPPLPTRQERWLALWHITWPGLAAWLVVVLPFLIWDPTGFLDDTFFMFLGLSQYSYPISGVSLGSLWLTLGFVKQATDPLALWMVQLPFTLIAAAWSLKRLWDKPTISFMLTASTLVLAINLLSARYFHDNHLGYLVQLFLLARFL